MKDGRQINRMTYLVRLPSYQKGDFMCHNNSYFYVTSLSGTKIHAVELSTWGEKVFDSSELQKARILGGNELVKEVILVSQTPEEVQVMDQTTYKTRDVRKPKAVVFAAATIRIVKIEDQVFLLPEKKHT
jgi:nonsense-mediated mRNA decay protein 3